MATTPLKFKRLVNVPPVVVYRAFTHPTALRDWCCAVAEVDARKGGRLYVGWNSGFQATGEFTTLEPGKKIAVTWNGSGEPAPTRVQVTFKPQNGGTLVTLTHFGIGSGRKWAATVRAIQAGWSEGLENLQSVLETGVDLRVARLPRLGIFVDDFNPEIAARLGVPAKQGIRLAGVADGTGAQAAGLQKDDVLVRLAGKKVTDFPTLGRALQGRHAGDKVPVVFYRAGAKKTVPLELSRRPVPQVLPLAELVETVRKNYVDLNSELAAMLEGLSDAQAGHRPAPEVWSVNDAIAHFILCERDFQSWVAQMVNDREIGDSLEFRPNVMPRIRALVERCATLEALMGELKHSQAETVAVLAALPPELVARKHVYQRAASWMLDIVPSHYREEHFGLMREAIEAARSQ